MAWRKRRAIAVGLSEKSVALLRAALPRQGYRLSDVAWDSDSGVQLVKALQPHLAVAGGVMCGGDGMSFSRKVRELRLIVQPGLLLLWPPGMTLPGGALPLGMASANLPLLEADLAAALAYLAEKPRPLPPKKAARLEAQMDALAVPRLPGRALLRLAVTMTWRDAGLARQLNEALYPELSRQCALCVDQVERALRRTIEAAWDCQSIEQQHKMFGDTIDARRGKPTCGEMIAQLAEELRWEA